MIVVRSNRPPLPGELMNVRIAALEALEKIALVEAVAAVDDDPDDDVFGLCALFELDEVELARRCTRG